MLDQVGFRLCKGFVARIQIVVDGIRRLYQSGKLSVGSQQVSVGLVLYQVVDIGEGSGVISGIVAGSFLAQIVLRVTVVSAPARDIDRLQLRLIDLLRGTGDVSLDVQLNIVVAQAVGEALRQYGRAVQSSLVRTGNVVVDTNREGDAQGSQFLNCLLFVLFAQLAVQADHLLAVRFAQAQLGLDKVGVVGSVGSIQQTRHRIIIVFAGQRVDSVGSAVVWRQIQAIVPGQTERLVGRCGVPVGVRCTILVELIVVEVELIGTEVCRPLNHLVVIRIALITADGHDVGLGQRYLIDLARLIQLVCDIGRFNHSDRDGIKAGALGIPVSRVFGEHLFIALNVGSHGVAAVVPHVFIVHRLDAVDAQLIHQALCQRVHAGVSANGIEVWFFSGAVINQCIIIRRLNVDHLTEDRALAGIQRISFFLGQALGVLIVLLCALNHLHRHGGVGRIVLIEVEHPLHSG